MRREFRYSVQVQWTGNSGAGTESYTSYAREYTISGEGKAALIAGSADPAFRGDNTRYNPEELFAASLSACHMLWYLHLCADSGITVISYTDSVACVLREETDGSGQITEITLSPTVVVTDPVHIDRANALHAEAGKKCFIANTCKCPIFYRPVCSANEADE